eukprot:6200199-Pleurochrysis_carterae.AAC.1
MPFIASLGVGQWREPRKGLLHGRWDPRVHCCPCCGWSSGTKWDWGHASSTCEAKRSYREEKRERDKEQKRERDSEEEGEREAGPAVADGTTAVSRLAQEVQAKQSSACNRVQDRGDGRGGEDYTSPKLSVQQLGAGAVSRDGGERARVDGGAPPAAEPSTSRSSSTQTDGSVGGIASAEPRVRKRRRLQPAQLQTTHTMCDAEASGEGGMVGSDEEWFPPITSTSAAEGSWM